MNEPTIALVFSPEAWVERLHRHLADHGGARVRQIVLDPALALDEHYDTLVVSDRWPGLTRSFVTTLRARGRSVLGVFDPDEPAGRDHLVDLGVDAVVSADAPIARFVEVIGELDVALLNAPTDAIVGDVVDARPATAGPIVVTGLAGSGVSEIALGLAARSPRRATVLVDADEHAPSLAVRLGIPLEPGLRSAIDAVDHGDGDVQRATIRVANGLCVVPGFPSAAAAATATGDDVLHALEALAATGCAVVAEVAGAASGFSPAVMRTASTLIVVAPTTPVAVTRLLAWLANAKPWLHGRPVHVVFNRAPRGRYRRAEVEHELRRTFAATGVWFVPTCRRVDDAVWRGALVGRGAFTDAVGRVARATVGGANAPRRTAAERGRRRGRAA